VIKGVDRGRGLVEGGSSYINFPHDRLTGDCDVHTSCGGGETFTFNTSDDYSRLATYVNTASAEDIEVLLHREKQLSFIADRGALKSPGAAGILRANLPLSAAQVARLNELQAQ
jgi:hypothetical protein